MHQQHRRAREARRVVRRVRLLRRRGLPRLQVEPPAPAITPRPPATPADSAAPRRRFLIKREFALYRGRGTRINARRRAGSGTASSTRRTTIPVRARPSRSRPGPTAGGHDVDAPHAHELGVGEAAVVAHGARHGADARRRLLVAAFVSVVPFGCRREPCRALDGGGAGMAASTARRGSTAPAMPRAQGRQATARDGHRVRRAVGPHGRRRRRRHDPRRRLARDGRARLRRHAAGHDRRHGAPRRRGRAARVPTRSSSPTCRG